MLVGGVLGSLGLVMALVLMSVPVEKPAPPAAQKPCQCSEVVVTGMRRYPRVHIDHDRLAQ
jgi:hypothetical protein